MSVCQSVSVGEKRPGKTLDEFDMQPDGEHGNEQGTADCVAKKMHGFTGWADRGLGVSFRQYTIQCYFAYSTVGGVAHEFILAPAEESAFPI